MKTENSNQSKSKPDVLVSDLDGTLIPLPDIEQNKHDLVRIEKLRETHGFTLIFATGRSFNSVLSAIKHYQLPIPNWIICNVGTSIYKKSDDTFSELSTYHENLSKICHGIEHNSIESALGNLKKLRLQPEENQSDFKISYWCEEDELQDLVDQINEIQEQKSLPYSCLGSIDPFNKRGLIDILPKGVDKAYAVDWLCEMLELTPGRIIYAGDSGNDLAALVGEYASVVVGNATDSLRSKVIELLKVQENAGACYFAKSFATSGVLEGMKHYQLINLNS